MNWLHGTPSTVKPRPDSSSYSFSSPSYCGVRPHRLATLTTRVGLPPVSAPKVVLSPPSVVRGTSLIWVTGTFCPCRIWGRSVPACDPLRKVRRLVADRRCRAVTGAHHGAWRQHEQPVAD